MPCSWSLHGIWYTLLLFPQRIGEIHFHVAEIIFPVSLCDGTHHTAGIAHGHHIGGDVPGDDAARAHHGIVSDGHAGKDHGVGSDPDVVADMNRKGIVGHQFPVQGIYRMAGGGDGHIGADHYPVSNVNIHIIHNHQIEIRVEMLSQMNVGAIGHMYRIFNEYMISAVAQYSLQNLFVSYLHQRIEEK